MPRLVSPRRVSTRLSWLFCISDSKAEIGFLRQMDCDMMLLSWNKRPSIWKNVGSAKLYAKIIGWAD